MNSKCGRLLISLNFLAEILDVAAEALGRLAASADERHESHSQNKNQ